MMILLKMAWLNIWRNRRRTVILLCAVVVGLAGVTFTIGFVNSWLDSMIDTGLRTYTGHIKVQGEGYNADPSVENSMEPLPEIKEWLSGDSRVKGWAERVTVQGLVQTARKSSMIRIVGIDPANEANVSILKDSIVDGQFLDPEHSGQVIVGRKLLNKFKTRLKRKLVVLSQRLDGEIGSNAFKISGVFDTDSGSYDETSIYILKSDAQALVGLGDRITELTIVLNNQELVGELVSELRERLKDYKGVESFTWRELMPLMVRTVEMSREFMVIFYAVFYIAMAFGILNTLLMSIGERTYEFGVMLALGAKRSVVTALIMLESCFIAAIASVIGATVGWLLVEFYGRRGMDFSGFGEAMDLMNISRVLYPRVSRMEMVYAVAVTFVVAVMFSVYPALRAAFMQPVKALRKKG